MMMWIFKKFWQTLVVLATIIGILYTPSDLKGLPNVLMPLLKLLAMIERETYLLALVFIFGGWIIWTDLRPFFEKLFTSKYSEERDAKRRREVMFEKTADKRFELAQEINALDIAGPLNFPKIEDLHAAFTSLEAKTDVYWGVGFLPNYIQDIKGNFIAAWCARNSGVEAGLAVDEQEQVFWHFKRGATMAKIHAVKWLQGEDDDYQAYIRLCNARVDYFVDDELGLAINKLAEFCNIGDEPLAPKVIMN